MKEQKQVDRTDLFERMPIPKAVATLAVPTMLSMLVSVIYNMADTFFVGQTNDANQVAAVSLAMPVFLLLMALGNMFGIGGSAYLSRMLGEGKEHKVKNISSFCFYGGLAVGILMIAVFLLGMPGILKVMGASKNTRGFAEDYLTVIGIGAPFVVLSNAFGNIVRGEGAAKASMFGMMLGTVLNIILDPIMILTMEMGVTGAALATIIGNIASVIYYVIYITKGDTKLSIALKDFRIRGIIAGVFSIGIPASFNNILMSVANIFLNNFLKKYGDIPVAAMGVASKANMLVILLEIGLCMGIQPLIGYCYGSGNTKRMKAVMRFTMICAVALGSTITLVYFFATKPIIRVFIHNEAVTKHGVTMLRALMLIGPIIGILFVFNFTIQAMGKAIPALIITLSRQGLVFLPVLFISDALFGLNGIIYSQPAADIGSLIITTFMFRHIMKKEEKEKSLARPIV